jgi:polyphosphate kinase
MKSRKKERSAESKHLESSSFKDFHDPELYLNREISWLGFNQRVLSEVFEEDTPLLERLKFVTIFFANLDEFFMVRLSGLLKLVEKESHSESSPLFLDDEEVEVTLDEVSVKVRELVKSAYHALAEFVMPGLEDHGIYIIKLEELSRAEKEKLDQYFEDQVFPVLTPLAVDTAHPFPYLSNLSLYLAISFEESKEDGEPLLAFVEVPAALNRLVLVTSKGKRQRYILLEDLVRSHLDKLFPWTKVVGANVFRVTRNLDYQLFEGDVIDLIKSIELELKDRAQKIVVRMEVEPGFPISLRNRLRMSLELDHSDVYETQGFVNPRDFGAFLKLELPGRLKDKPFTSQVHSAFVDGRDIFEVIREQDVLLHHPYDSFSPVLEFVDAAAKDPNVLAIKQTLYRTGGDSPIIDSLVAAAEKGKQVTAVVELKARFDEQNNIVWSRRLERAGAHVVFGFVGLKTHAKCLLIVRREGTQLRRYVHLSTGNYNSVTAKFYTDLSYFTARIDIANDVGSLFNLLTGFNILGSEDGALAKKKPPKFDQIFAAPFHLRERLLKLIEEESELSKDGKPARIMMKMNALTDSKIVAALYKASQMGVKITLIVRGMCVLRPGLKQVSENIRVLSLLDRFLEHSRIYWFGCDGKPKIYLASADMMPRNLDRRVEIMWPILDKSSRDRITSALNIYLKDNCKVHEMQSNGSYVRMRGENRFRAQEFFIKQNINKAD